MLANAGDRECAEAGTVCSADAALAAAGDATAAAGGVGGVGDAAADDDLA
jgi:hypothetical protein